MPVQIKVDEDLPAEVTLRLRSAGHDARTVVDQGLSGTPDRKLWARVQQEGRLLLTADKGFADAHAFPAGTHRGIILLRLPRETRAGYVQLIESLLGDVSIETVSGSIVVVTPDAIRIHHGG